MSESYVIREELRYAERLSELKATTSELKELNREIKKDNKANWRFATRMTAGLVFAIAVAFVGAAYNSFAVHKILAELTIKIDRVELDVSELKTDVSELKTNQRMIYDRLMSLEVNQDRMIVALERQDIDIR